MTHWSLVAADSSIWFACRTCVQPRSRSSLLLVAGTGLPRALHVCDYELHVCLYICRSERASEMSKSSASFLYHITMAAGVQP